MDLINCINFVIKKLCTSIPVVEKDMNKKNSGKQILECRKTTEQGALGLAQKFPMVVTTDIREKLVKGG